MPDAHPHRDDSEAQRQREIRYGMHSLWTRMQRFCTERGWSAEIYVREDRGQFGRVGVLVDRGCGETVRAFGRTTNEAIRQMAAQLDRDGFDAP